MGAVPPRAADIGDRVVATPATQSSQFEIASPGSFTQAYHHFFVQDDWRVSPKLTANLGLRLEINSGMHESSIATWPDSTPSRRTRSSPPRSPTTR